MAVPRGVGRLGQIQAQGFLAGFAATRVGSVALEAVLRKNASDVPIELQTRRGRVQPQGRHQARNDEAGESPADAVRSWNS